jgi:hypothetical protein
MKADVRISHVVAHDEQNIRLFCFATKTGAGEKSQSGESIQNEQSESGDTHVRF